MSLPGVTTSITDRRVSKFAPPSNSNWFAAGYALRGSTAEPTLIKSMTQKESLLGPRTADTTLLHDALESFFREGGTTAYVSRIIGPGATAASVIAQDDTPADSILIEANSEGVWGNDLEVVITNSGAAFSLSVEYDGSVVEASPEFSTIADAIGWSNTISEWVTISDEGGDLPDSDTVTLTGGDDDLDNVTSTEIEAALAQFDEQYGAGQVSVPGLTSSTAHEALLAHAASLHRVALLDAANSSDINAVATAAGALSTEAGAKFGGVFWPWITVPGIVSGTARTVPPSGIQAGIIARSDALGKGPGEPAAGANGISSFAIGLSQDPVSDADRETLNDAGVNAFVLFRGEARCYGNRTLADASADPNWSQLSQSRVVSAVAGVAQEIGQQFYQKKIDGRGFTVNDFGQEIAGRACLPLYISNDLYGETPADAFSVDVGPEVNPPENLASGILAAVVNLRTSPGADQVSIEIVKVPTGENL